MEINGVSKGFRFNIYRRDRGGWEYMTTRRTLATAQRYARLIAEPGNAMVRPIVGGRLGKAVNA